MVPLTIDFANLHTILGTLYEDMLPLCKDMMDVGKGLAGLGALFYVAVRIWQSMARAEPIDVYPLLRPFEILYAYRIKSVHGRIVLILSYTQR